MTERSSDEPITFVDKRKIDPDSGEIREAASEEPLAGAGAAPQPGLVDEDAVAEAADVDEQRSPGSEQSAQPGTDELAERTADLQRLTAEYANYRRRVERDRKAVIENAKASVVSELLGILDDLDRARAHGDLESGPLKSLADKLVDVLTKQGVTEFGVEGEPFDPTVHEAVQHDGEGRDPVIGAVLRKGYRIGDRVLRHALVAVTDGVSDLAEAEPNGDAQE